MRPGNSRSFLLGAGMLVLLAPRPGEAARKDMEILQSDVDELQRQVYDLRRMLEKQGQDLERLLGVLAATPDARESLAAFNANVDGLRTDIRSLASRFEESASRIDAVERRLADCMRGAGTLPGVLPAGGAPPDPAAGAAAGAPSGGSGQALFQQAYGDYIKDNFELALAQFREFVETYPQSDLADNAQYWIAMSYYNQEKHVEALAEIDRLLERWPDADNASEALYRKGLVLLELNRVGQAVLALEDVSRRFPGSPAAAQAEERLRAVAAGAPAR